MKRQNESAGRSGGTDPYRFTSGADRLLNRAASFSPAVSTSVRKNPRAVNPNTFDNLWKQSRKNGLYAEDLLLIAKHLNMSMEELPTGEQPEYLQPKVHDPVIAHIEKIMEALHHDQLVELRRVVRAYVDRHLIDSSTISLHAAEKCADYGP